VTIDAAILVGRPLRERVVDRGIDSQKYRLAFAHDLVVQRPGVNDR
jgi:hypothetical protein